MSNLTIEHPYDGLTRDGGQWLSGNLHAHTNRSDGSRPAQQVIDDYAARGYDFLMLSDHDVYASREDYAPLDDRGMVLIPGNEISRDGPHMLHVNADRLVEPSENRQEAIDAVAAGAGFVVLNHPNWNKQFDHCPMDRMRQWTGYVGLEIYNGVIGRLPGSPYATDKWDMLLSAGRRVWGFANDDSHHADEAGRGWNMAWVRRRTAGGVVEALRQGRFYGSTGVSIDHIEVKGRRIRIRTRDAERVVAIKKDGRRLAVADGPALEVEAPEQTGYVRFECWGRGERFAWTQPLFLTLRD